MEDVPKSCHASLLRVSRRFCSYLPHVRVPMMFTGETDTGCHEVSRDKWSDGTVLCTSRLYGLVDTVGTPRSQSETENRISTFR